ncbi:MAG: DNA primase [Patescibacteria group bacterium]|nr:DNA primase [Patescibacteria group bacterium]
MENQIDEIKSKTDIVSLISEYVSLKKAGRNYKANCPFHTEKTPSFMVSPERGIFKCFGCGEGGDAFNFLMKIEGVEFDEALKQLARRAGIALKEYHPSPVEKQKEILLLINEAVAGVYHRLLIEHSSGKKALDYLKGRGLTLASIKSFKLGYSPNQWEFLGKYLSKKGFNLKDVLAAGLIIPSSRGGGYYDRFRGRIIFPIFNIRGEVVGFSGRVLESGEPKYLNSPETPIFDKSSVLYGMHLAKEEAKKLNQAVLVEGNLDVISSHQVGVRNVTAPLGTALTFSQLQLIKRYASNIALCFDTDLAGDSATKRGIEIAENLGMNINVVRLKFGKDPDECIKKDPKLWQASLQDLMPIYDYYLSSAISRYGLDTIQGKRKVGGEFLPLLTKLEDEILRAHYVQKLSALLGVTEEALNKTLNKQKRVSGPVNVQKQGEKVIPTLVREEALETYLLALLFQTKKNSEGVETADFNKEKLRTLFELYSKEGKSFSAKEFASSLSPDLLPVFDEIMLVEIEDYLLEDDEKLEKEFIRCFYQLKSLNLKRRLKKLEVEIKQAEILKDVVKLELLNKEFRDLSVKLKEFNE